MTPALRKVGQLSAAPAAGGGHAAGHHRLGPERRHPIDGSHPQLGAGGPDRGNRGHGAGRSDRLYSGYFGGRVDAVLRVLIDVFLSVPSLLFLILIASLVRGVSVVDMALIIGAFAWPSPARQVRAQVLSLKERGFVQVARLSGDDRHGDHFPGVDAAHVSVAGRQLRQCVYRGRAGRVGPLDPRAGSHQRDDAGHDDLLGAQLQRHLPEPVVVVAPPVVALMALFLSLYLVHIGLDEVSNPRLRGQ